MNSWSKLIQMGAVVIDVQGMTRVRAVHLADEIRIREDSFSSLAGDMRNRYFSASSFSSRSFSWIVDDDVDNWLGFRFLKNLEGDNNNRVRHEYQHTGVPLTGTDV